MPSPKTVTVDVVLKPNKSPPFELETNDLPVGKDGELIFRNDHFPGFIIHFRLKHPSHGYLFPDSSIPDHLDESLYSSPGASCPTSKGQWGQFKAQSVEDNGRTLVVRNMNGFKTKFGYTLRVTDDAGASYLDLDPIGGNENGPISAAI